MLKRLALVCLTALLISSAVLAQDEGEITLTPYTDDSYLISGVTPENWTVAAPGLWVSDTQPQSLLGQQAAPVTADAVMAALMPQFGLTEVPEPVETIETDSLTWMVYFVNNVAGADLTIDFALASRGGATYIAVLQTDAAQRDALRESVFLPVLDALTPLENLPSAPDDAPYTLENLTFPSGEIRLAGTLTLPEGDGPHPAVVLISGSGAQDRDESLGPPITIRPFALIADHLSRNGIAVLRYDDRGFGQSEGDFASATSEDFADDASAAMDYLMARDEIDAAQVGVLGHSEGGIIAALLLTERDDAAFAVLMSGSAVSGLDVMIRQNERLYDAEGLSEEEKQEQVEFVQELLPLVIEGDLEAAEQVLEARVREQIAALSEAELTQIGDIEAAVSQTVTAQMEGFAGPWWRFFLTYDPAEDFAKVTAPVLGLFGTLDVQVDAEQNAGALREALETAGNPDFEIVIFPDVNHLFQRAVTGSTSEYGTLQQTFAPEFLPTVTEWLLEHVTLPE